MKILTLSALGWALELVSFFIFVQILNESWVLYGKSIVVTLFLAVTLGLFVYAYNFLNFIQIMKLALSLAVGAVVIYQSLGFLYYSGLVKGLDFLSWEHIRLTFIVFAIFTSVFFIIAIVVFFLRKIYQTGQRS